MGNKQKKRVKMVMGKVGNDLGNEEWTWRETHVKGKRRKQMGK